MRLPQREQGMTLLMSLIMLIILTLLALASFNLTQANMQVVTNMQQRDAVSFAARGVLDEVLSSASFHANVGQTLDQQPGCKKGPDHRCIDSNGDGVSDVVVKVAAKPVCVKVESVKTSDLNLAIDEELRCSTQGSSAGVVDGNAGNSLCADSVWEVQVEATDELSQAKMTVTQGIGVRVAADTVLTKCPQNPEK